MKSPDANLEIQSYLVVVASFVVNMVVEGSYNVWSIAYTTLTDEFETTRANAAWAGSVLQSTPSMFGPFASAIINRYGCRKATIAGALIACLGWFIGSFSRSILFLALTFGLIGGFGLSLAYIPSLFIVAYYFQKRLSLATSIAMGGSGVGALIYAPLTDFLIREYTWRGAIMIFSGFFLQMAACGMLFIVPENGQSQTNDKTSQTEINKNHLNLESEVSVLSVGSIRSFVYKRRLVDNYHGRIPNPSKEVVSLSSAREDQLQDFPPSSSIPQEIAHDIPTKPSVSNKHNGQEVVGLMATVAEEKQMTAESKNIKKANKCIDFSILKNRVFRAFCIQSFLVYLAYDTPLMNMPGFAISEGIPSEEAALLLSIFGVFTTIGQIGLGWLADLKYFNNISLFVSTTVVAGIATVAVSSATSYGALALYCVVYGVFISADYALSTAIFVEYLGKEALNDAFGISSMAEGLAILIGPPIGGFFYDVTGNYKMTYVCAGLTITLSTAVFYLDSLITTCSHLWTKSRVQKVTPENLNV